MTRPLRLIALLILSLMLLAPQPAWAEPTLQWDESWQISFLAQPFSFRGTLNFDGLVPNFIFVPLTIFPPAHPEGITTQVAQLVPADPQVAARAGGF